MVTELIKMEIHSNHLQTIVEVGHGYDIYIWQLFHIIYHESLKEKCHVLDQYSAQNHDFCQLAQKRHTVPFQAKL